MTSYFKKYFFILYSSILIISLQSNLFSQTVFQKTFGDSLSEFSFSAKQTNDKGYVLSGYGKSYGTGGNNFYLIKTDSIAVILWSKIYGTTNDDQAYSVQQTSDGGYIIAGYTRSTGGTFYDACLLKTDANGDTLWTKIYGGGEFDYANKVIQTTDGGYILAGFTTQNIISGDSGSIYIVKTNSSGNIVWQKVLGGGGETTDGYSIRQTSDKGFVITGYTSGFGEINGNAYLLKTDSLANPIFTKTYGYKGVDWGNSVEQTSDGGYVIGGSYSIDSTSTDIDAYIIKTDANGDTLWTRIFGGASYDYGQTIEQTSDGGYILGGYTYSFGNGNSDMFLIKVDANGDTLFTKTFGGLNDDEANCAFTTSDGGYSLAGLTSSFGNGNYDLYFVKTDSFGNSSCNQTNIHATKRISKTVVTPASALQVSTSFLQTSVHPVIYSGATPTDACNPIAVAELRVKNSELRIFPNPSSGVFYFSLENFVTLLQINIKNILGEIVYSGFTKNSSLNQINLDFLPNGTYFLQVTGEGKSYYSKFLVNK